jgi:putative membrane protein
MRKVHSVHVALLFVGSVIGLSAQAQQPATPMPDRTATTSKMPVTATSFANQAATIGQAEIELGRLAQKNSNDADVKKYAERMVKDHTAAAAQLQKVATQENLALPKELDAQHQAVKEKLSKLKGEEFDAAYAAEMAKGHDKAVALFESASQSTSLPAGLKQFAATTLPTLKEHREMAHDLHGKEGA